MRKELKEYPFDWMLWRTFAAAARLKAGSEKEYRQVIPENQGFIEIKIKVFEQSELLGPV